MLLLLEYGIELLSRMAKSDFVVRPWTDPRTITATINVNIMFIWKEKKRILVKILFSRNDRNAVQSPGDSVSANWFLAANLSIRNHGRQCHTLLSGIHTLLMNYIHT